MTLDNWFAKFSRVPATAKIFLLQNLAIMIKTGVPLVDGLHILTEQSNNRRFKNILEDVSQNIRQGKNFGDSLTPYEKDFGELFINMIKAGEVSGQLETVLKQLYVQTKKDYELKNQVRNALIYPTVIVIAMIGIGAFVIFFVLPNITALFSDMKVELPLATRILINFSNFIQKNGPLTAIGLIATLAILIKSLSTRAGKHFLDVLWLKTPIISGIIKKVTLARLSRNLSSLLRTDIDIISALNITSRVLNNSVYAQALSEAGEKVKKGQKLEVSLKDHRDLFPPLITQMVAVGEETGSLDEVLESMAGFYEDDVSQTMASLPTIIEPVLMIGIGLGVAGIALAILMPIFSLTQNF